mmetsp:Transcript_13559/g.29482  ORF Transcript_13559/g.29482 Transcript_13559/m.29482 type:complete len:254 (-) Transcript_13559:471-1232(-)
MLLPRVIMLQSYFQCISFFYGLMIEVAAIATPTSVIYLGDLIHFVKNTRILLRHQAVCYNFHLLCSSSNKDFNRSSSATALITSGSLLPKPCSPCFNSRMAAPCESIRSCNELDASMPTGCSRRTPPGDATTESPIIQSFQAYATPTVVLTNLPPRKELLSMTHRWASTIVMSLSSSFSLSHLTIFLVYLFWNSLFVMVVGRLMAITCLPFWSLGAVPSSPVKSRSYSSGGRPTVSNAALLAYLTMTDFPSSS